MWELSAHSTQFYCELKTPLQNKACTLSFFQVKDAMSVTYSQIVQKSSMYTI